MNSPQRTACLAKGCITGTRIHSFLCRHIHIPYVRLMDSWLLTSLPVWHAGQENKRNTDIVDFLHLASSFARQLNKMIYPGLSLRPICCTVQPKNKSSKYRDTFLTISTNQIQELYVYFGENRFLSRSTCDRTTYMVPGLYSLLCQKCNFSWGCMTRKGLQWSRQNTFSSFRPKVCSKQFLSFQLAKLSKW